MITEELFSTGPGSILGRNFRRDSKEEEEVVEETAYNGGNSIRRKSRSSDSLPVQEGTLCMKDFTYKDKQGNITTRDLKKAI
jgi:hypothetical protein